MTSLPWPSENAQPPNAIRDRSFLVRAKEQLDSDHYGLDKIKRRLIEFLAVIRLHQLAADAEHKAEEDKAKRSDTEEQSRAVVLRSQDNADKIAPQPSSSETKVPRRKSKNAVKGPILLYVFITEPP